jgi:hypothetical protein
MADIITSQTRIANRALILLGSTTRLISIEDDKSLALQMRDLWHESRRAAIVSHPWNFALFRQELNEAGGAPAFGWERRFAVPTDCLRWLPPARDQDVYFEGVEEEGYILSNTQAPLPFRGIKDVPDVTKWPPHFVVFMGCQLAMDMAESVSQFASMVQDMAVKREEAWMEAKRLDGLASGERMRANPAFTSRWVQSRGDYYSSPRGRLPGHI